ncbi:P-loop containing nucleoside triphosphate hydrolase protein [Dimargaris cristalligena]|uniref:P-loop containing nucleoside triphosphate hydrolase protein n=1 Tax=Dimargaris cristalligena TaxID=215637 RepID=A0A4P9ZPX0_9FUNG|nr:P-loop containing nucleoside triphosphate hydrolase protein [Dimargaris cristalligena]|eukprot:RKP35305.1 P-loop containing nucleoside triphosphate hydrolase protein [Dimargaris cristalligena]
MGRGGDFSSAPAQPIDNTSPGFEEITLPDTHPTQISNEKPPTADQQREPSEEEAFDGPYTGERHRRTSSSSARAREFVRQPNPNVIRFGDILGDQHESVDGPLPPAYRTQSNITRVGTSRSIGGAHLARAPTWNAYNTASISNNIVFGEPTQIREHVDADDSRPPKELGLLFENLDVYGQGTAQTHIETVLTPVLHAIMHAPEFVWRIATCRPLKKPNVVTKHILHGVNGYVRPGEMLLVLGKPGAGCSTMLRIMGNERKSYSKITGDVSYGGISPQEIDKHYRGEVVYNQEEDYHYPTFTVRNTIDFALKMKTPSTRILTNRSQRRRAVTDILIKMFGLQRCADTIVGNSMIRGISGGEKKRTSIAEQMATDATITVWDGSTKGLDASSALDYVRSLRIVADLMHRTTAVSLYQASENIYNIFDKVMVIADGRCIFFGPAQLAKSYFQNLGYVCPERQTTSDFLTGITTREEARVAPGMEERVPRTAEEFENSFRESHAHARLLQEIQGYRTEMERDRPDERFREMIQESKMGAGKSKIRRKSRYKTTYWFQIIACLQREIRLTLGNPGLLVFRMLYNWCMAVIVGSLFFKLPDTSYGAFTRGGVLFFALLFNTLVANSEIPKCFSNRPILYKQKSFAFYHPSALYLAQLLSDIPIAFVQVVVFSAILYWMTGLQANAGKFFIFMLILFGTTLCLTALFRLIGNACPDLDTAHAALVSNEFKGLLIRCSGAQLIPSGAPQYNDIAHQVCTLAGSRPGTTIVRGEDYIRASNGFKSNDLWRDFVAVMCFYALFMPAGELGGVTDDGGGAPKGAANGLTLSWENIKYIVPGPKRGAPEIQLLNDVNGYVKPGQMTALMGASGAGKTTLLDVLAQRKNVGRIEGEILLSGEPLTRALRRQTGYCEQMDIHNPSTTVREALQFSAELRQPASVSKAEKYTFVERVLDLMEMDEIADAMVGTVESGIGLSTEERKRLTIAVELVAKPKVLFLDEPTSGLDAQSSFSIVRFLRKLAAEGQTVLCTIHQPSSLLFEQFDRLLLLAPGGNTVYFGDLGHNCETLIHYFESHGAAPCAPTANPAEYILDVIGSKSDLSWPDIWRESPVAQREIEQVHQIAAAEKEASRNRPPNPEDKKEFSLHYPGQCALVLKRMFRSYWRDPEYNLNRIFLQVFCSFFLAITFIQLGDGTVDLQNRIFVLFQTSVLGILIINQVQPQLIRYRTWFTREEASGFYDWRAFATGMVLTELPYVIFAASCFFGIFYWAVGLNSIPGRIGYFYIMYIALSVFAMLFGQAVAAWTPNEVVASMVNPIPASFMALFCGVTIPYALMPTFWRRWMYWIDPYHYFVEGLLVNDLYQQRVVCKPDEFYSFKPPSGQSCGSYVKAFLSKAPGYLSDPANMSDCRYCPYKYGQDYYENQLDWSFAHRYRNFLIMVGFCAFNLLILLLGLKFYRSNKR